MAPVRYIAELFARFARSGNPRDFGKRAEKLAEEYLRLKGYRILARNWRTRFGEIDLVVQKGDVLVFVEVKARRSRRKGLPEEALTPGKRARLLTLARCYLSSFKGRAERVRFDVLALDFSGKFPDIKHFKGVIEDG